MMRAIIISALGLLASGCATGVMSERQCLAGDWYGAGLEDGASGLLERQFDERAARCAEFGAPADRSSYFAGREDALVSLCSNQGGYDYGRSGKSYLGVCRPGAEREFLGGYLEGWRVLRVTQDRDRARADYDSAVSLAERYRQDVRQARRRLQALRDDEASTDLQIADAREDLRAVRDQMSYAEQRVEDATYELGRADEALSQTVDGLATWRGSAEYAFQLNALGEAQNFARAENAVDYCTDDSDTNRPRCVVAPGAVLRDTQNGAACVVGPSHLALFRRGNWGSETPEAAYFQRFRVFPLDGRGRPQRRGAGDMIALFDGAGEYAGMICPRPEWGG